MKVDDFEFELGQSVRDVITGFRGYVSSRIQHITGCNQYDVKPRELDKDDKMKDGQWFDEGRLEITDDESVSLPSRPEKRPGGPAPDAPRKA